MLRYAQVIEKHQNCVLNTASLSTGWICAAGLMMVGNFQVGNTNIRTTLKLQTFFVTVKTPPSSVQQQFLSEAFVYTYVEIECPFNSSLLSIYLWQKILKQGSIYY